MLTKELSSFSYVDVSMHPLEQSVRKLLSNDTSLTKGQKIIIGVSGGPDSIALLHVLSALSAVLEVECIAVYVDHGLRPQESPLEKQLIAKVAFKLGVAFETVSVDTKAVSSGEKKSLEHAGRELRYKALHKIKNQYSANWIAVGHNADEQVEEILIRLLRGSSRKALSGMRVEQNSILRPLLKTLKYEIYRYLEEKDIPYCVDSSNDDPVFLRNRIRHNLLPVLEKEYDTGIRKALLKTAENLGQDESLLESLVMEMVKKVVIEFKEGNDIYESSFKIDRILFNSYHNALQRRCIETLLWKLNAQARYEHILAVINASKNGQSGSELHLSKGLRVKIEKLGLTFFYPCGRSSWRGNLKDDLTDFDGLAKSSITPQRS